MVEMPFPEEEVQGRALAQRLILSFVADRMMCGCANLFKLRQRRFY
jgi:hypothetical protein